ncbi:GAF domain-containing protein [Martelella lutilitoris]|nr:GAF domain-containing protein [Martelella lutilitoris]
MTALFRLAAEPYAARRVFAYLLDGLNAEIGKGLTTASVYDLSRMRSRRVFSENVEAYALGGFKPLERNRYYETVIASNRHFSTTTIEQIAEVFFDWEKIRDLGFESNMNLPAIADGRVIGTVNLLGPRGHFTQETVARALAWQPAVTAAFLLLNLEDTETATFHPDTARAARPDQA